ncbi:MAG: serine hydrolase domain-containing protein [Ginsengibacter sp.]
MSKNTASICLKCTLILSFLLLLQVGNAQNKFGKVQNWLNDNIEQLGGRAVLMIYKNGKIVFSETRNKMNKRQKILSRFIAKKQGKDAAEATHDYTAASKIAIASCSKWLSAALVMTFVDEGKLNLEDSVGKFLAVMTANGKGGIKIWECLSHLTGIAAGSLRESIEEMKNTHSMDEAIEKIAQQPKEGEPGKTFHYSNLGLQIAGAVVEKISGKNFETLFAERIAGPCEMKNTDFGKGKVALPAGGAYSTTEDYLNFLEMILHNGKFNNKNVLSEAAVIKMQQNYARGAEVAYSPAEASGWGYGFGEWVMEDTGKRSNAVTSPGLFGSFPWVDNERNYAAVLFCFNLKNKGRGERYKDFKKLIDEAIEK